MNRRNILLGAAAGGIAALVGIWLPPGPGRAGEMALFEDDRIMGSAEAPITIIEYSSLTCPHCAAFHADALPQIKETWIADGRVRLVYRHFPLGGTALRAAAVADCIEGERFFGFLDLLFKSQKRWAKSNEPLKALGQMARLAGMSQEKFDACANDEAEMDRSEMYRWRAGFGFRYFIGGQLLRTDSTLSMAALQRSRRQGHVTQLEIEAFGAFRPHLGRALRIQGRVAALEQDVTAHHAARRIGDQAHDRKGSDGLTASAFADEAEDLVLLQVEVHPAHDAECFPTRRDRCAKVANRQDRPLGDSRGGCGHLSSGGEVGHCVVRLFSAGD
ncbi:MAG: thioredoxin domain-containing protein [Proteobacteria bacterium]|nr:thioredoxin domain-containing protein [Pseudomonadota bacterium]